MSVRLEVRSADASAAPWTVGQTKTVDLFGAERRMVEQQAPDRIWQVPVKLCRPWGLMPEGAGSYHKGFSGVSAICTPP